MQIELWWTDKIAARPQHTAFVAFAQAMANRLIQGFCRYGPPVVTQRYMSRMRDEMTAYRRTGNAEHLYNIANYCVLECAAPENGKYHVDTRVGSATRGRFGGARE